MSALDDRVLAYLRTLTEPVSVSAVIRGIDQPGAMVTAGGSLADLAAIGLVQRIEVPGYPTPTILWQAAPSIDHLVLAVARAHGTPIAAEWSGWTTHRIIELRRTADGYDRGRGRPSLAELEARSFRWDCPCPRCIANRGTEARHLNKQWASTDVRADVVIGVSAENWRDHAACIGLDPETFFPARGERIDPTVEAACARCPVRAQCLDHALHFEKFGYWAGTSERQRRQLRKARNIRLAEAS